MPYYFTSESVSRTSLIENFKRLYDSILTQNYVFYRLVKFTNLLSERISNTSPFG